MNTNGIGTEIGFNWFLFRVQVKPTSVKYFDMTFYR